MVFPLFGTESSSLMFFSKRKNSAHPLKYCFHFSLSNDFLSIPSPFANYQHLVPQPLPSPHHSHLSSFHQKRPASSPAILGPLCLQSLPCLASHFLPYRCVWVSNSLRFSVNKVHGMLNWLILLLRCPTENSLGERGPPPPHCVAVLLW